MDLDVEKYFDDCSSDFFIRFQETTPDGNCIEGWMCTKRGYYFGSLLIDTLNNKPCLQFVQGMPDVEVFKCDDDICFDYDVCHQLFTDAIAYEKLDGTLLMVYPLLDENGLIIELVPRVRDKPVLPDNIMGLYDKVDKSGVYSYYEKNTGILFFELFGLLNTKTIKHYSTGIDMVLFGCYDNGFATPYQLWRITSQHPIKVPEEMFRIEKNRVRITTFKYKWYYNTVPPIHNGSKADSIKQVQELVNYLNDKYQYDYGEYANEGVVINCVDSNGRQKYIKVEAEIY